MNLLVIHSIKVGYWHPAYMCNCAQTTQDQNQSAIVYYNTNISNIIQTFTIKFTQSKNHEVGDKRRRKTLVRLRLIMNTTMKSTLFSTT